MAREERRQGNEAEHKKQAKHAFTAATMQKVNSKENLWNL
jgi:hypothetical protein